MNEGLFQLIMRQSPLGYAFLKVHCENTNESQFEFIEINPAFGNLLSLSWESVSGVKLKKIENFNEAEMELIRDVAAGTGPGEFEYYSDSAKKHYKVSVFSPDENLIVLLASDISNHMHRLARLNILLSTINDIIFEIDSAHCFRNVWVNDEKNLFMPKESFLNKRIDEVFSSDIWRLFEDALNKARDTGERVLIEYGSPIPGDNRYFKAEIIPRADICNKPVFVAVIADITSQVNRLSGGESDLLDIFSCIPEAVICTDEKGIISRMNPSAENLTGYKNSELAGKSFESHITIQDAETRQAVKGIAGRVLRDRSPVTFRDSAVLVRKDKSEVHVSWDAAPVVSQDGTIRGLVILIREADQDHIRAH